MTKRRSRNGSGNGSSVFGNIILDNTVTGLRDESYTLTVRSVEQLLKDPEIRDMVEQFSFAFLEKIVEKWRERLKNKGKKK